MNVKKSLNQTRSTGASGWELQIAPLRALLSWFGDVSVSLVRWTENILLPRSKLKCFFSKG